MDTSKLIEHYLSDRKGQEILINYIASDLEIPIDIVYRIIERGIRNQKYKVVKKAADSEKVFSIIVW